MAAAIAFGVGFGMGCGAMAYRHSRRRPDFITPPTLHERRAFEELSKTYALKRDVRTLRLAAMIAVGSDNFEHARAVLTSVLECRGGE